MSPMPSPVKLKGRALMAGASASRHEVEGKRGRHFTSQDEMFIAPCFLAIGAWRDDAAIGGAISATAASSRPAFWRMRR